MNDAYEMALALIERDLKRSFRLSETTETIRVDASFARLQHLPILTVKSVTARKRDWEHGKTFGPMPPVDIPIDDVEITSNGVILPQTMWGSYDEATVTYEYGHATVPPDIDDIARLLAQKIDDAPSLNTYTAQLLLKDDEIENVLRRWR